MSKEGIVSEGAKHRAIFLRFVKGKWGRLAKIRSIEQILGQNSSYVFSVSSPQEGRLTQSHNEERSGRDRIFFLMVDK